MNKILAFIGVVVLISTILFFIYKEGEQKGKTKEIKQNQEIEIKIKDEIIVEQKQIIKRKEARKSITTNDNLKWLRENRCKDCKSK